MCYVRLSKENIVQTMHLKFTFLTPDDIKSYYYSQPIARFLRTFLHLQLTDNELKIMTQLIWGHYHWRFPVNTFMWLYFFFFYFFVSESINISGADPDIFKRGGALCPPPWLAREENVRFQMDLKGRNKVRNCKFLAKYFYLVFSNFLDFYR